MSAPTSTRRFRVELGGWWRLIWLALGLAPLALMVTGVSTWLFRRGVKKRRKKALSAHDPAFTPVDNLDEELIAGHLDEVDPVLVHEHLDERDTETPAGDAPPRG